MEKTTHVPILNELLQKTSNDRKSKVGSPGKSGKEQISSNSESILQQATVKILGGQFEDKMNEVSCKLTSKSLDGRGRPQRSMRVTLEGIERKLQFRSYHITWCARYGEIPKNVEYSHRCHEPTCVEPTHGVWESNDKNHDRNRCKGCSHLFLPNGKCVILCPHIPSCLVGVEINEWSDSRVIQLD